jgi:hypothetical protein
MQQQQKTQLQPQPQQALQQQPPPVKEAKPAKKVRGLLLQWMGGCGGRVRAARVCSCRLPFTAL